MEDDSPKDPKKEKSCIKDEFKGHVQKSNAVELLAERAHSARSHNFPKLAEKISATYDYKEIHCQIPTSAKSTFLMVFSADKSLIASNHGDHNIYISAIENGKQVHKLVGHQRTPWAIAFHPKSNSILASGCLGGEVRVWNLGGQCEKWTVGTETVIASVAFHPFDNFLAIASGNIIYFWDWREPLPQRFCVTRSEFEKIRYVRFDNFGSHMITGIFNCKPHVFNNEIYEMDTESSIYMAENAGSSCFLSRSNCHSNFSRRESTDDEDSEIECLGVFLVDPLAYLNKDEDIKFLGKLEPAHKTKRKNNLINESAVGNCSNQNDSEVLIENQNSEDGLRLENSETESRVEPKRHRSEDDVECLSTAKMTHKKKMKTNFINESAVGNCSKENDNKTLIKDEKSENGLRLENYEAESHSSEDIESLGKPAKVCSKQNTSKSVREDGLSLENCEIESGSSKGMKLGALKRNKTEASNLKNSFKSGVENGLETERQNWQSDVICLEKCQSKNEVKKKKYIENKSCESKTGSSDSKESNRVQETLDESMTSVIKNTCLDKTTVGIETNLDPRPIVLKTDIHIEKSKKIDIFPTNEIGGRNSNEIEMSSQIDSDVNGIEIINVQPSSSSRKRKSPIENVNRSVIIGSKRNKVSISPKLETKPPELEISNLMSKDHGSGKKLALVEENENILGKIEKYKKFGCSEDLTLSEVRTTEGESDSEQDIEIIEYSAPKEENSDICKIMEVLFSSLNHENISLIEKNDVLKEGTSVEAVEKMEKIGNDTCIINMSKHKKTTNGKFGRTNKFQTVEVQRRGMTVLPTMDNSYISFDENWSNLLRFLSIYSSFERRLDFEVVQNHSLILQQLSLHISHNIMMHSRFLDMLVYLQRIFFSSTSSDSRDTIFSILLRLGELANNPNIMFDHISNNWSAGISQLLGPILQFLLNPVSRSTFPLSLNEPESSVSNDLPSESSLQRPFNVVTVFGRDVHPYYSPYPNLLADEDEDEEVPLEPIPPVTFLDQSTLNYSSGEHESCNVPEHLENFTDPEQFFEIISPRDIPQPFVPSFFNYERMRQDADSDFMNSSFRIQSWPFSLEELPPIHDATSNIVIKKCMIHNDASLDVSQDGQTIVALIPVTNSHQKNIGIFSLKPDTLGQELCLWGPISNVVSVSFSPQTHYVILGIAAPRPVLAKNVVAAIIELEDREKTTEQQCKAKLIRTLIQEVNHQNEATQINAIRWLPQSGTGFVYSTNRGSVVICQPGKPVGLKKNKLNDNGTSHLSLGL